MDVHVPLEGKVPRDIGDSHFMTDLGGYLHREKGGAEEQSEKTFHWFTMVW